MNFLKQTSRAYENLIQEGNGSHCSPDQQFLAINKLEHFELFIYWIFRSEKRKYFVSIWLNYSVFFINFIFTIALLSPLGMWSGPFIRTNTKSSLPKDALFGLVQYDPGEDFHEQIVDKCFCISLWCPFRMNLKKKFLSHGWFVPSLFEISPVVLEVMKMCKVYYDNNNGKNFDQKSSLDPSVQVSLNP